MLLLYRKPGEEILVNQGEIKIKVITMSADSVLIGVHAPEHITIDRPEVLMQRRRNQNKDYLITKG